MQDNATQTANGAERRQEPRYRLAKQLIAQVKGYGWRRWFAPKLNVLINNVSAHGIGLHSKTAPPESGTRVSVTIMALGDARTYSGLVRHVAQIQSGYLFGVELKGTPPESLISYLKACEVELEIR